MFLLAGTPTAGVRENSAPVASPTSWIPALSHHDNLHQSMQTSLSTAEGWRRDGAGSRPGAHEPCSVTPQPPEKEGRRSL